jgi:hypothetical protein
MSNKTYLIIKKISYIVIGLVLFTVIVDIFFADNLRFGRERAFVYFEGILFALFILFEVLKWYYKKKFNE